VEQQCTSSLATLLNPILLKSLLYLAPRVATLASTEKAIAKILKLGLLIVALPLMVVVLVVVLPSALSFGRSLVESVNWSTA
jgi:hypothetical protein